VTLKVDWSFDVPMQFGPIVHETSDEDEMIPLN